MQLLLKIMCWSSYQTRRTLVSLFSDISLHGRDIRYCDIFLRWWPACISLVWVCPRVPRCIKGFERTKYMCFCPQIEPVKVASVLEKSFKNFHDKHGIGEAELKWVYNHHNIFWMLCSDSHIFFFKTAVINWSFSMKKQLMNGSRKIVAIKSLSNYCVSLYHFKKFIFNSFEV